MPTWAIVLLVYGLSAPLALAWANASGFLPWGDPVVVLRLPAVVWIGPAIALVAIGSIAVAAVARAAGAERTEAALAWWRARPD
ncbi:MAG: hypothetical protein R3C15_17050 [Thermoleophilia bacterium]